MTKRARMLGLVVALAFAGCDDGGGGDAGLGADAGPRGDAGEESNDAGPPRTDAGPPNADAGPYDVGTCTPVTARVVPTCDFTACGGDPTGSWCYTDLCLQQADLFPGIAGCPASVVDWSGVTGTVTGRLTFDGTTARRVATTQLAGTLGVPASCVPIPGLCGGTVAMAINGALGSNGSATCAERAGGGCDCDVTVTLGVESEAAYTVAGDVLTIDGRTFDFCSDASGLSLRETGMMPDEPATQTFAPE